MKKSGKTLLAAMSLLWWCFTTPHTEAVILANDLEQAQSRVFKTAVDLIKADPVLSRYVRVKKQTLHFTNGTIATVVASDYKGAAGSRHSLAIFDELWGYELERATRLFEEMTPIPGDEDSWILITTTAGFTGESTLLESLYQRGLAGTRVDQELELYEAAELFMFWSHTPRQPWQTPEYYAEQRRILREPTYLRLHENRWTSPESRAIPPELWDGATVAGHTPYLFADPTVRVYAGVDASTKGDSSAVVGDGGSRD